MDSNFFHTLRKLLEKLPGIGPRQANRFLWAMLDFSEDEQKDLARAIAELPKHLRRCTTCWRAFSVKADIGDGKNCSFCLSADSASEASAKGAALAKAGVDNSKREKNKIMVIEKDNDILNIERSGAYGGLYHVLGGMIDPLDENPIVRERIKKLYERVGKNHPNYEVILALSPTKTGEFTSNYITKVLEPLAPKITRLARGLSTGVELEYADEMTIRHALDNRR